MSWTYRTWQEVDEETREHLRRRLGVALCEGVHKLVAPRYDPEVPFAIVLEWPGEAASVVFRGLSGGSIEFPSVEMAKRAVDETVRQYVHHDDPLAQFLKLETT